MLGALKLVLVWLLVLLAGATVGQLIAAAAPRSGRPMIAALLLDLAAGRRRPRPRGLDAWLRATLRRRRRLRRLRPAAGAGLGAARRGRRRADRGRDRRRRRPACCCSAPPRGCAAPRRRRSTPPRPAARRPLVGVLCAPIGRGARRRRAAAARSRADARAAEARAHRRRLGLGNPVTGVLLAYRGPRHAAGDGRAAASRSIGVWSLAPDRAWGGVPGPARRAAGRTGRWPSSRGVLPPFGIVVGVYIALGRRRRARAASSRAAPCSPPCGCWP